MQYGKLNYKKSSPDVLVMKFDSISTPNLMKTLAHSIKLKPDMKIFILGPDHRVTYKDYMIIARWFALEYRSISLPELRTFLSSTIYLVPNHKLPQNEYFGDTVINMIEGTTEVSPAHLKRICAYDDLIKTYEKEVPYERALGFN